MSEPLLYIAYYVKVPAQKIRQHTRFIERLQATQEALSKPRKDTDPRLGALSQAFLEQQAPPGSQILESFIETPVQSRTLQWPELQKALQRCQDAQASLLIVELGKLANNRSFTQPLLASKVPFVCADQPFVTATILEAFTKHAEVQRTLHAHLIREGLKMTSAKSGNPHASKVIGRVNKPKIDTAILFAFLVEPLITQYQKKNYSQRQMVRALNEEGFTAPEGGQWVLSQLQKVLDRIRLNTVAYQCQPFVDECFDRFFNSTQIIEALHEKGIPSLKGPNWDIAQLKKICDRIQQMKELTLINQFLMDLLPLLREASHKKLSNTDLLIRCMQEPRIQKNLVAFPEGMHTLEAALESAVKHLNLYLKVVKEHLDQLTRILALESHHHTTLDSIDFPKPLHQLIQLLRTLDLQDIKRLESLALTSLTGSELAFDAPSA